MPVLIGLDYGTRRIGIAVSDEAGKVALPVGVHVEGRDGSVLVQLADLALSRGAEGVVLGLPLRADGSEGDIARRARRFGERVGAALGLPVVYVDERYTSQAAARQIALRGRPARRGEVDDVAAQMILQDHLDRLQGGGAERP
ncbi:MAG: Holliday junction resolvase RuvX [Candidatus Krumholzibacteriia bacterium]